MSAMVMILDEVFVWRSACNLNRWASWVILPGCVSGSTCSERLSASRAMDPPPRSTGHWSCEGGPSKSASDRC